MMRKQEQSIMISSSGESFVASYHAKDLILYALSIGFGSSNGENEQEWDLEFLYEKHPRFAAVPTFCLVLLFWAKKSGDGTSHCLPSFPPDLMASEGVLPSRFLRVNFPVSTVIHTWQSIRWHCQLPVSTTTKKGATSDSSIRTVLRTRTLSVKPKSGKSGTYVTSQTLIFLASDQSIPERLLCTLKSTAFVVGIPSEYVIPYKADRPHSIRRPGIPKGQKPFYVWQYATTPNQALLYRLASGDTNHIHVEPASKTLGIGSSRAVLHGLCTLGVVARAIMTMNQNISRFLYLECRFTKPVLVGDELCVQLWRVRGNDPSSNQAAYVYNVVNTLNGEVVVDGGYVELREEERDYQASKL